MPEKPLFSVLEKTVKVLIADDEPLVLENLSEMISAHLLLYVGRFMLK